MATAAPGAQLPSTRTLVAEHDASPVTVQKALRTLSAQGLIETRAGIGAFVRATRTARPHDYGWQTAALGSPQHRMPSLPTPLRTAGHNVIAFHGGYPDKELLPERLVRSALSRAARGAAALRHPPTAGLPDLRAWFADELGSATPPGLSPPAPGDAIVLPGSQSGMGTLFRALVGADRPLLIESPSYWGAILAAAQVGVRLIPVPSGPDGPDPVALDDAFVRTGARAFYAQPNFANPTGGQWCPALADEVLRIVRDRRAFLIEDDWAHDFGIDADPVPLAARDDGGHVVYIRSLTKSVSPSIRVAGLIARGPARERILADAEAQSMYVSAALQAAALDVVSQPAWTTHLRSLRQQLSARRDLLVEAIRAHLPDAHVEPPRGGLHLWARLPDDTDLPALVRNCETSGVLVAAGDNWFPAEPTGRYLRLSFCGPDPGSFPDGVRVIADTLARQRAN
ncbi:hypothetical protein MBRU_12865 [Mycolicibacterium brumae DSM 44177]|nr:hypothetical protein MBRU_12865 [Mycolicibacterium brumae DSM 44177]